MSLSSVRLRRDAENRCELFKFNFETVKPYFLRRISGMEGWFASSAVNKGAHQAALNAAPTRGWKEIEKSPVLGRLGDAVRTLRMLPSRYVNADLQLLEGDAYDNAPATFGPDDDGMWYRVNHTRSVSFLHAHFKQKQV